MSFKLFLLTLISAEFAVVLPNLEDDVELLGVIIFLSELLLDL